jgi:hypothetical protein
MTNIQAISILTSHFDCEYLGSYKVVHTGNLIEDIMNEGDEGKTFHQWATLPLKTVVSEDNLAGLASYHS